MMIGFLDSLKRERDISIEAMSSGGKMAFRCNSPLKAFFFNSFKEESSTGRDFKEVLEKKELKHYASDRA